MRFPLSLNLSLTKYLMKQSRERRKRFPIVLMLEPTHLCNLHCKGCGRIYEYKDVGKLELSVDQCLAAVQECGSPIVTVTGGEPLLHKGIADIVSGILKMRRHVFLCTNAIKLKEWLPRFEPRPQFQINVHMDGLRQTHDDITGRPGTFDTATEAIREAKRLGFRVCTNTTVFKTTPQKEIVGLMEHLKALGVNGILLSPGFNFESNGNPVFMTREEIKEKFLPIVPLTRRYPVINTPIFMDFLTGRRELPCTPWGNPTRNVKGWKGPCYMITDAHYATFRELMESTDWERFEKKQDPRCRHCMTHCGFEPSVMLQAQRSVKDALRMLTWDLLS